MPDAAVDQLNDCRRRVAGAAFRIPAPELNRELAQGTGKRDGALSARMLRINASLAPLIEEAVLLACRNLGFPREMVDVYVRPQQEINAYSSRDGDRAVVTLNSLMVEISDLEEIAYVVGHELGHYLLPESNVRTDTQSVEGCMLSRHNEFTMDRIGLLACRSVEKACSAEMKTLSGLSSRFLRVDVSALIDQWREASRSLAASGEWIYATHPPPGMRAKALVRFHGSDAYRQFVGLTEGEAIANVNEAIGLELDHLVDRKANDLIAEELNKLSGWLCAFMAAQNVKVRAASLRHGLCTAPEDILRKCIGFVINETSQANRVSTANERLIGAIQKCSEVAPGHTRVYLQAVAKDCTELQPLVAQLTDLTRQRGIILMTDE
jgi:hypothetical protein